MIRKIGIAMIAVLCLLMHMDKANASGLGKFLTSLGVMYNGNLSPQSYQLMSGGMSVGMGAIAVRVPRSQGLNGLFNITAPSFEAGCNGLNLDTGGLFFITDPNILVNRLQSYGTSAVYGMIIGLAGSLPIIGDALKTLQQWQEKIFGALDNACKLGQQIGGDIRKELESYFKEEDIEAKTKQGIDATKSIHLSRAKVTRLNVVVDALAGTGTYEDAEFIMTLIGTVIFKPQNNTANGQTRLAADAIKRPLYESFQKYIQAKKGVGKEYNCPNVSGTIPVNLDTQPTQDQACLNPTTIAISRTFDNIESEYSDYIMAMIFASIQSNAWKTQSMLLPDNKPFNSLLHGQNQGVIEARVAALTGLPQMLQELAKMVGPMSLQTWNSLRTAVAYPISKVLAIADLGWMVAKVQRSMRATMLNKAPKGIVKIFNGNLDRLQREIYEYQNKLMAEVRVQDVYRKAADDLRRSRKIRVSGNLAKGR